MRSLLVTALALTMTPSGVAAQAFEGTATAIDGDTLDMTGMRIRLLYLDAPEAQQTCTVDGQEWACGSDATSALASLVDGQKVSCVSSGRDTYGRYLATCRTRSFDLSEQMLALGLSVASEKPPERYLVAEQLAKDQRLGLWASEFLMPRDWRAAHSARQPAAPAKELSSRASQPPPKTYRYQHGCAIKGNRSRRGEWIYHLPGQQYYEQTRPEELFCTEAEAQAAGYRRSKV